MNYDLKDIDLWDGNFPISDCEKVKWREALEMAIEGHSDSLVACTGDTEVLVSYGSGKWTAWSLDWVYFPAGLDGSYWIARVPRHPCDKATETIGRGV